MPEPWSSGSVGLTHSALSGRPRTGASVESGSAAVWEEGEGQLWKMPR